MIAVSLFLGVAAFVVEYFYLRPNLTYFYSGSPQLPIIPRAYGLLFFVNIVMTSFILLYLGFQVSAARAKYREKAVKDGEPDAEDRFNYPKLYAEGFTINAKLFNCVQRGHQQALETYSSFVALSLVSGLFFPFVSTFSGIIWCVARIFWAKGYASGEPKNRYESVFSYGIWTSFLIVLIGAAVSSVLLLV